MPKPDETMPRPKCKRRHPAGDYVPRPELATRPLGELTKDKHGDPYPYGHKFHGVRYGTPFCPPDVACPCGALLRYTVPLFKVSSCGWEWRIFDWTKEKENG